MLACAFVACSNDSGSSDDGGETLIASFHYSDSQGDSYIRFYSGNKARTSGAMGTMEGTYTGDPTTNGTVVASSSQGSMTFTISNSGQTLTYTNASGNDKVFTRQ